MLLLEGIQKWKSSYNWFIVDIHRLLRPLTAIFSHIHSHPDMEFVKKLHRWTFRLKILHRQFHLISIVLVAKNTKMSKNGEIYTTGKNFTLPPGLTGWTNSTSALLLLRNLGWLIFPCLSVRDQCLPMKSPLFQYIKV